MPIKTIRRYAEFVSAGHGNGQERLALMEAHRADVAAKLAELQENLKLIDHTINVYRGRLAAGDADQPWRPTAERASGSRRSSGTAFPLDHSQATGQITSSTGRR